MPRDPARSDRPTARWVLPVALAAAALLCARFLLDAPVGRWATGICGTSWASTIRRSGGARAVPLGGPVDTVVVALALFVLGKVWRWPQARRAALLLPVAFIASGAVTHVIKMAVGRPRPFMVGAEWPQETRWQHAIDGKFQSFPSGDVTVAAALATVCFLLAGRRRFAYLAVLVPAYSATARMVAARHYPSDCLAGCLIGGLTAWLLWRFQERRWPLEQADGNRAGDPAG
jgi:undecaprenyl-diphosphatase